MMRADAFTTVEFAIPEESGGRCVPPAAIQEFEALLAERFGGWSARTGRGAWLDPVTSQLIEDTTRLYQVALLESRTIEAREVARDLARKLGERALLLRIGAETVLVVPDGEDRPTKLYATPATTTAVSWPDSFDVAIQVVIGRELQAVQTHFAVDPRRDQLPVDGAVFHRGRYCSESTGDVSVVIYCQGNAGNDAAAVAAERLIARWHPKAIFLLGIAAGRRGKCKIGDVVTPRVVVNDQLGVARMQRRLKRSQIYPPPQPMIQQLVQYRLDSERWHACLADVCPPRAPRGQAEFYRKHVARKPSHHESAIYSSNLLLRDPNVLRFHAEHTHEQIRVGEMEAAGFSYACQERARPVPWLVVRGVSDFGDQTKGDEFQLWASHAAASLLLDFLKHGLRIDQLA
jgi:nucleoside phosphorylase